MKDYSEVNAYMAEKCGVSIYSDAGHFWIRKDNTDITMEEEWTILDPRCREIIREKFGVMTGKTNDRRFVSAVNEIKGLFYGKTIAEAECNCILAIWESEK